MERLALSHTSSSQRHAKSVLKMEFASILGVAASISSIVELSTACVKSLLELRAAYRSSELHVQVAVAQLSTLNAALTQISTWRCLSNNFIPYHLEADLNLSLHSCKALMDGLNEYLSALRLDKTDTFSSKSRLALLMSGREWSNLQTLLSHQVSAIQLFLTTMQW